MIYLTLLSFSFLIRFLSRVESEYGALYSLAFFMSSITLYFYYKNKKTNKNHIFTALIFASSLVISTEPLYENDQYRYLWEGKVLASGFSPYKHSPHEKKLDHIDFPERKKIAYNKLTTIYPPISIILFASLSQFKYSHSLIILQIFNLLLALLFIHLLYSKVPNHLLIASTPLLLKEYIQSVHVDLFAALFFLIFLISRSNVKKLIFYWLSIFTKLIPILFIPFFTINKKFKYLLGLPVILAFYLFIPSRSGDLSGPKAFALQWKWNAGFYELLLQATHFNHSQIKTLCLIFFSIFFLFFISRVKNDLKFFLLVIAALLFFAPVYNAWYGIWLIIPAMLLNSLPFFVYSMSASISYVHYGQSSFNLLASLLTHICFLWGIYETFCLNSTDSKP